jgi:hypothetical protein
MNQDTRRTTLLGRWATGGLLLGGLVACGEDSPTGPSRALASPLDARARPMVVEPASRNSFGPGANSVPEGTTFYVNVITGTPTGTLRLHLCRQPCHTSTTIRTWPGGLNAGTQLSHEATQAGAYYLWLEDPQTGNPITSTADSENMNARRITFANGGVIDGWYVTGLIAGHEPAGNVSGGESAATDQVSAVQTETLREQSRERAPLRTILGRHQCDCGRPFLPMGRHQHHCRAACNGLALLAALGANRLTCAALLDNGYSHIHAYPSHLVPARLRLSHSRDYSLRATLSQVPGATIRIQPWSSPKTRQPPSTATDVASAVFTVSFRSVTRYDTAA